MSDPQTAIYARVSSEQQAEARTIASQVAALRARVVADGVTLVDELTFIDDGYSGATLVRPALERLRDLAAAGGVDRVYVHSPDRLARKYAYQVLLLDELATAGVEVVFLNRELGRSPEDDLLLQVQGMVAEYERAKILERSRRGKRHGAQTGVVSVLSGAPYGYHYIRKDEGGGTARYEIVLEEARVVRQVFHWVGQERATIGEVRRRLTEASERTRTGKTIWDRATVWGMLKNPAYVGSAGFGKTRAGPLQPRLDPNPPKPLVSFEPHAGANGVAFSRSADFGFEGDAFVALFGDLAPVTTPRQVVPAGFKVVRIDMRARRVVNFAANKIAGPASKLPHDGFERPSHCAFGPDGSLYVVDWGEIQIAPEVGGVRMKAGTGALWRIRRTGEPADEEPPEPIRIPFYPLQYALWGAGAAGLSAAAIWLLRRLRRTRRPGVWDRIQRAAKRR